MHPRARHLFRSARRIGVSGAIPIIPLLLAGFWLYTLYRGERTVFTSRVAACDWSEWETWPEDARPHRAILIADPQLVDPHTYPGRPWPLSALTERYTDRYMARSYRLINELHDPDSIIFLGDMFDGGREWAPGRAPPLNKLHKWQLEKLAPNTALMPTGGVKIEVNDPGWNRREKKRDLEGSTEDAAQSLDLTAFVHGENGRWSQYDNRLWNDEYKRFGNMFMDPKQLYPHSQRSLEPIRTVQQTPVNLDNGALERARQQYAIVGSKSRAVLASLPGNHDLGFGSGVQMPVRARYKWRFGDLNRLDILGNHSFVSIDTLSLAAWSQYELRSGTETTAQEARPRTHIYAPAQEFIDNLPTLVPNKTQDKLAELFPATRKREGRLQHDVQDIEGGAVSNDSVVKRAATIETLPIILLSHVPLYRPADTDCGPLRERGHALTISGGYQYQNVLTETLSDTLIDKLEDVGEVRHIFSGDDHDYCKVTHSYSLGTGSDAVSINEETIKSFSWAMGVRLPAFHMVSLWNPIDSYGQSLFDGNTIQSHLCLLPDQLAIFIHYATMAGLTVLVLLVRAVVLALRAPQTDDAAIGSEGSMPMLPSILPTSNSAPSKTASKHRHRASSTSLKPMSNGHLGVQRSANARARSVSPGAGLLQGGIAPFSTTTKPLIDQAGYYGSDVSDDEESKIGDMDYLGSDDSQAKWKRRRRSRGKLSHAFDELLLGLGVVAGVAVPFYIILISRG